MRGKAWRSAVALASVVVAAMLCWPGSPAYAHTRTFNTTMTLDHRDFIRGEHTYYGQLGGHHRCTGNRPVRLIFGRDGERWLVDRARTSSSGNFGLAGDPGVDPGVAAWIRAPRIRVGPKTSEHRHFCRAVEEFDS